MSKLLAGVALFCMGAYMFGELDIRFWGGVIIAVGVFCVVCSMD